MSTMEIITSEMRKQRITTRKLCKDLNLNETTFSCWKQKDVEPRLVDGLRIIQYLRIPASTFTGEPDPPEQPPAEPDDLANRVKKIEEYLKINQ